MNEVVNLAKERQSRAKTERYCFTCPCGNQTFVLRPDAKLQCVHCDVVQPALIWGQFFPSNIFDPPFHSPDPEGG